MELFEKSLSILELPQILELLAAEAVSEDAKSAARLLRPYTNTDRVRAELGETTAAKHMMVLKQCPPFSGVKNIHAIVKRADMGGMLGIRELLDIAELLRAASSSMAYFRNDKVTESTAIDYLFSALSSNRYLHDKIQSAIISEEEISDNASPALADIRRHIRIAEDKVRQTLNHIITSPAYAKVLQEPIITIRNNRYVVPVRADQKANMPGMVHDISSSGATQFIEPMSVVNINNELRELASREKDEIDRILMELSADVAGSADSIISDFEILTKLDFIFAKAKLSYSMDAIEPELSADKHVKLCSARHPLLPKGEAVAIDIRLGADFDTLVITGPNTGGKTVSLKTLGLLCAMSACGLHIPVQCGSSVYVFHEILADIGDEQSIEQSLSTFSAHMTNIVAILENCTDRSLLLFDELGAGTDPIEGAALAISIIEYARESKALIAATTHYAELKSYALRSEGVMNASCEFDVVSLKPTYRLIIGIPGKSNAFAISKQLGLLDEVIEDAKSHVSTENIALEETLRGLEEIRIALEHERAEAAKHLRDAEEERQKAIELRAQLDRERDNHVEKARREAAAILEHARKTAKDVVDEIKDLHRNIADGSNRHNTNEVKSKALGKLNEAEQVLIASGHAPAQEDDIAKTAKRDIVPGDRVMINDLGTLADVISISNDGVLTLQGGIMKITAHLDEVTLAESKDNIDVKKHIAKVEAKLRATAATPELDIRGLNVEEAIPALEQFLDNAKMAHLSSVTIIHGKGTGVLRKAVHNELKHGNHKIKRFRLGVYGEGEDGVTIVEL